ncbi:MAG TPA: DUF2844 domain-containing protein [Candidatus Angelobacter sp.]
MPLLAFALPAVAELGGNVSSIQADQEHMKGTRRVTTNAAYSVHEIQAATGTTVREFVSPSGTVFAVAWQGPATPDLQQLLGAYFGQFTQAIQTKRAGRGPVSVRQEGLVVEAGGHMRSFSGRAYLPQMMPQGVSSEAIK